MWYEEGSKTNYQGGNMQQGHYTQVLWKGTYALGCGVKNCGQMTLVFCDYAPAGTSPFSHSNSQLLTCLQVT